MRARRSSATRSLESEMPSDRRRTLVGAIRRTTSGANPRRARYRLASREPVTAVATMFSIRRWSARCTVAASRARPTPRRRCCGDTTRWVTFSTGVCVTSPTESSDTTIMPTTSPLPSSIATNTSRSVPDNICASRSGRCSIVSAWNIRAPNAPSCRSVALSRSTSAATSPNSAGRTRTCVRDTEFSPRTSLPNGNSLRQQATP